MITDLFIGRWRAVLVLGVTQIITWGTLFYPPVLTLPLVAADRGWSVTFAMTGFSLGLLMAGVASARVGLLIDRHGGHRIMAAGSLLAAAGLVALVHARHPAIYLAVWMVLGVATAASLYDSAFATLGRIFGRDARSPITVLTLAGGLASTVSWPVTYLLIEAAGWRGAYLVYAGVLALIAAPLHAFALPRRRAETATTPAAAAPARDLLPPRGIAFVMVTVGFAAYAFVPSGLSAHLLAIFGRAGLDAATVVAIGTMFGPAQVLARVCELMFARRLHPLLVVRLAVGLLLIAFAVMALAGLSVAVAMAFMLLFGIGNGLVTIARGTVPLALFGPVGYGAVLGRIARPCLAMQAVAPLTLAFVAERGSDSVALAVVAALALVSFCCLCLLRPPRAPAHPAASGPAHPRT